MENIKANRFKRGKSVIPFDARFHVNFGMIISGPPGCGKTHFALSLIENADRLLDKKIDYIVWFFGEQGAIEKLSDYPEIRPVQGLPEDLEQFIEPTDPMTGRRRNGLFIFDDLMTSIGQSEQIANLAANKTQHANISWICLLQNAFSSGKHRVDLSRCAHYLVLYKNPLDKSVAKFMAQKIMPDNGKVFMNMFNMATEPPFGCLVVDGTNKTPDVARFRTDVFHPMRQLVYVPNEYKDSNHFIIN